MADGPAGFHFDELNKVRVLEPEISQQTQELKEECKEFVDSKSELFLRKMCEAKLKKLFLICAVSVLRLQKTSLTHIDCIAR